ncbi:RHS repeat-associated core domain-containing protein [Shewanella sp. 3B26]|uniref:RHS repeat-associated core domain-containing protein n=1 Tax=Shewanella zhuhaiensis TaxID=2919576 RepID=A0AAJ1BHB1_9GAMM|nr:RHS repeat-associated core domain-containing protein [Shewanella zhuhaiensis]MCH4294721.1 RHS repeat-associated core domain-containing protein [Shewanella zhuhaiensis]
MQARYYDPLIGRFYADDPIGFRDVHSFNRYAYANNNPYKYVDPDGESSVLVTRISPVAQAVRTGIRTQANRTPSQRMQEATRQIQRQMNDTVKNSKEVIEQQPIKPSAPVGDDSVPGLIGRALDALKTLSDMGVFSDASTTINGDAESTDNDSADVEGINETNLSLEEIFPDFDELHLFEVPEV